MHVLSCKSSWGGGGGGVESVEALRLEGAPLSTPLHDTDNHYFDVRQTHDTRMEYVRKTGRHGMFTTVCVN